LKQFFEVAMQMSKQAEGIIDTYKKHGWQLARVLITPDTSKKFGNEFNNLVGDVRIKEAAVDALWFMRPSHEGREAWELRLVDDVPYALFETFEKDEAESDREDRRREMEAELCERVLGGLNKVNHLEVEEEGLS
jgi:hypothetical protein